MKDDLGDRMKIYEGIECNRILIPRLPIYARLDGKCFSRLTRNMSRPFDTNMSRMMIDTTKYLVEETHAIIGYTQSDEISLGWHFTEPKSEPLFGGKLQKLHSIFAGMASAKFTDLIKYPAVFDCRVFNLPNIEEWANAFLWRELDATKNAISMAASCYFSPKQLHGKDVKEKQEMLFQHHDINFNDYPAFFKRGTFVRRITEERHMTDEELSKIPFEHRPIDPILRSKIVELEMPRLLSISNRVGVLLNGEEPKLIAAPTGEDR